MRKLLWILPGLGLLPATAFAASEDAGAVDMTHRMMLLVIQLGVILFAAKLGNLLFEKIRLPGALGELAAGRLRDIDHALDRAARGELGVCDRCGGPIQVARLRALPGATGLGSPVSVMCGRTG